MGGKTLSWGGCVRVRLPSHVEKWWDQHLSHDEGEKGWDHLRLARVRKEEVNYLLMAIVRKGGINC